MYGYARSWEELHPGLTRGLNALAEGFGMRLQRKARQTTFDQIAEQLEAQQKLAQAGLPATESEQRQLDFGSQPAQGSLVPSATPAADILSTPQFGTPAGETNRFNRVVPGQSSYTDPGTLAKIFRNANGDPNMIIQSLQMLGGVQKLLTPGQKIAGKYEIYNPNTGRNEVVTYNESGQATVVGEAPQKEYDPRIPMSKEIKNRIYTKKVMPDQVSGLEKNGWVQGEEKTVPPGPEPNALVQYWDENGNSAGFFPNNVPPPKGCTDVPPERPRIVKNWTLKNFYMGQTNILKRYGGGASSFSQFPGGGFKMTTGGKNAYQDMKEKAAGGDVQAKEDLGVYNYYGAEIKKLINGEVQPKTAPALGTQTLPQGLTEADINFNMQKYGKSRQEVIDQYKKMKGIK